MKGCVLAKVNTTRVNYHLMLDQVSSTRQKSWFEKQSRICDMCMRLFFPLSLRFKTIARFFPGAAYRSGGPGRFGGLPYHTPHCRGVRTPERPARVSSRWHRGRVHPPRMSNACVGCAWREVGGDRVTLHSREIIVLGLITCKTGAWNFCL